MTKEVRNPFIADQLITYEKHGKKHIGKYLCKSKYNETKVFVKSLNPKTRPAIQLVRRSTVRSLCKHTYPEHFI